MLLNVPALILVCEHGADISSLRDCSGRKPSLSHWPSFCRRKRIRGYKLKMHLLNLLMVQWLDASSTNC